MIWRWKRLTTFQKAKCIVHAIMLAFTVSIFSTYFCSLNATSFFKVIPFGTEETGAIAVIWFGVIQLVNVLRFVARHFFDGVPDLGKASQFLIVVGGMAYFGFQLLSGFFASSVEITVTCNIDERNNLAISALTRKGGSSSIKIFDIKAANHLPPSEARTIISMAGGERSPSKNFKIESRTAAPFEREWLRMNPNDQVTFTNVVHVNDPGPYIVEFVLLGKSTLATHEEQWVSSLYY